MSRELLCWPGAGKAKDDTDADKWMTAATEQAPSDSEAWYSLGRIKYSENRFEESIHCFEKALSLAPHLVKAENNLGLAYEGLNQVDDAVKAYRTVIVWQANSPSPSEQPLVNLGIVLLNRNDLSEALPLLQQAVQIAPADARIRAALAGFTRGKATSWRRMQNCNMPWLSRPTPQHTTSSWARRIEDQAWRNKREVNLQKPPR